MGDSEGAVPQSKKRVAGRQITQLDPEPDDDAPEPEMGTFQRASEEVLATRRIVKVRRNQPSSTPSSSNPFAGICLISPPNPSAKETSTTAEAHDLVDSKLSEVQGDTCGTHEKNGEEKGIESGTEDNSKLEDVTDASKADENIVTGEGLENGGKETEKKDTEPGKEDNRKNETEAIEPGKEDNGTNEKGAIEPGKEDDGENRKEVGEEKEKIVGEETQKAVEEETDKGSEAEPAATVSSFQQLSSSQNAFTGLTGTGFATSSFSFGSLAKEGSTFSSGSLPSFGIGSSNNGSSFSFNTTNNGGTSSMPSMQEVPVETGEENEKAVFNSDAVLYEYLDGGWKERGKGELKVNVSVSGAEKARLVMRARGNYRLILNASLYPDMSLASMDKRGVTFACVNSAGEGKTGLTTFALKFRDANFVEEFRGVVTAHKGKLADALKTPDNSPKVSDD